MTLSNTCKFYIVWYIPTLILQLYFRSYRYYYGKPLNYYEHWYTYMLHPHFWMLPTLFPLAILYKQRGILGWMEWFLDWVGWLVPPTNEVVENMPAETPLDVLRGI